MELDLASACFRRLHNGVTISIRSLRPHFRMKHNLAFNQTAKDTSKRTIDDPHSSLNQLTKMLPQFEDSHESKKKTRDYFKLRFQKKFLALLEEEVRDPTACAKPSKLPQRHFCAMCGFRSPYTCNSCWARYCCVRCLGTQHETRYTTVS
uniref:HIT-type domain-containing protein n=1 Tax=Oncorhynchus kisutch TaxID=8019 RepID=A0A8C7N8B5_ONCKI